MYPIIFSIGPVNIYSHGVMIVLGGFCGAWIIYYLAKKQRILNFIFLELVLAIMLAGFIGARVFYVLIYPDQYQNLLEKFHFWQGGMVSFGGILGALIVAAWYLKLKKQNIWQWFDIGAIGLFIGWGVGRIGCFLNGDVQGIFTLSKFSIYAQVPVPLYESLISILIASIIYLFYRLYKHKWPNGIFFTIAIFLYGTGRFIIDFWRSDNYSFSLLSYSQVGDLLTISIAIGLMAVILRIDKRKVSPLKRVARPMWSKEKNGI